MIMWLSRMTRIGMVVIVLSALIFSGCFRKFIKSDGEIEAHYAMQEVKPVFTQEGNGSEFLHYAEMKPTGVKPLLFFIHGAPGAWYGWMKQLDDSILQSRFDMVSVDRPGYGKSKGFQNPVPLGRQAELLASILKKLKKNREVILVARSYGSPVACRIAMDYPELVQGMVLISSAVDPAHEKFFWFSDLGKKSWVRALLPDAINLATDEKFKHQEDLNELLPCWNSLNIPVRILVGENDNIVDPLNSRFLDSVLFNSPHQLIRLAGVDHLVSYRKPEIVRKEILELSQYLLASSQRQVDDRH